MHGPYSFGSSDRTEPTVVQQRVDDIQIETRLRRNLNETSVEQLVRSILDTGGLLQPIIVSESGTLVAGHHRLEAFRRLGYSSIPCIVVRHDEAIMQLAEIEENLCRDELSVLQQAEHLLRREQILETQGRRAQRGRPPTKRKPATVAEIGAKTTAELAAEAGLGARSVRNRLQIARRILPELRDIVRSTPEANSTRTLLALARLDEVQQTEVAALLTSNKVRSVAAALRSVCGEQAEEKKSRVSAKDAMRKVQRIVEQLPDNTRADVLSLLAQWVHAERQPSG